MPRRYRNTTLVMAMTELGMINHLGFGIESMNRSQARRYLPLPEYDLTNPGEVRLTIWGSVVNEAYTRTLMRHTDLSFEEVMALGRVQKGNPLSDEMLRRLRRRGLVEGRRPHLRVAANVAEAAGTKAGYLEERGQSAEYCVALINDFLVANGPTQRGDIDRLVFPHLPQGLDDRQRTNRVDYLLKQMREDGRIKSVRMDGKRMWIIS